jgi:hypothetical protein
MGPTYGKWKQKSIALIFSSGRANNWAYRPLSTDIKKIHSRDYSKTVNTEGKK